MNILVVCQYYWPEQFQITDICEGLVDRGHNVTVLTGLPNYPEGTIPKEYRHGANRIQNHNGVSIIRSTEIGRGHSPAKLACNFYSFSHSATKIAKKLPADFDVVFAYQLSPVMMALPAVEYAKKNEKPLLLYCCDLWPESMKVMLGNRGKALLNYYKGVSRNIYSAADILDVESPTFIEYFQQELGLDASKMVYVPQFATGEFLDEDFEKKHCDAGSGCSTLKTTVMPVHFCVLGNIGIAQDADIIVQATAIARELSPIPIVVHFVGEGRMLQPTKSLAKALDLGDSVVFHGRRANNEMPEFYRMANACILALNGDSWIGTTLPSRLQGYMAAGKPVLGAVNGGAKYVIEEAQCGKVVSAGDAEGLACLMVEFAANPQKYAQCGKNGREYFRENFCRVKHLDTIEKQLKSLSEHAI